MTHRDETGTEVIIGQPAPAGMHGVMVGLKTDGTEAEMKHGCIDIGTEKHEASGIGTMTRIVAGSGVCGIRQAASPDLSAPCDCEKRSINSKVCAGLDGLSQKYIFA